MYPELGILDALHNGGQWADAGLIEAVAENRKRGNSELTFAGVYDNTILRKTIKKHARMISVFVLQRTSYKQVV